MTNRRTATATWVWRSCWCRAPTSGAPPKAIHDVRSIARNWEGTVKTHRGPQVVTAVVEPDGKMVANTAQGRITVLERMDDTMWASDYLHAGSTWPESQRAIQLNFKEGTSATKKRITCDNARALYRLQGR